MAKENINSKQGFTIIEVVLVLAIAGLIFLMVFVALPALQRSQRDTQRRNDLSRVDTSLTQYQTNHQDSTTNLPKAAKWQADKDYENCNNDACDFIRRYMNTGDGSETEDKFADPDGTLYNLEILDGTGTASGTNLKNNNGTFEYNLDKMDWTIYIVTSARCSNDTAVKAAARDYAVLYRLEGSGVYCIDNR